MGRYMPWIEAGPHWSYTQSSRHVIYIYIHNTHTHTHIYIYVCIYMAHYIIFWVCDIIISIMHVIMPGSWDSGAVSGAVSCQVVRSCEMRAAADSVAVEELNELNTSHFLNFIAQSLKIFKIPKILPSCAVQYFSISLWQSLWVVCMSFS